MPKMIAPSGTVVTVDQSLADHLKRFGWSAGPVEVAEPAEESEQVAESEPQVEKPVRRRRTSKSE